MKHCLYIHVIKETKKLKYDSQGAKKHRRKVYTINAR